MTVWVKKVSVAATPRKCWIEHYLVSCPTSPKIVPCWGHTKHT